MDKPKTAWKQYCEKYELLLSSLAINEVKLQLKDLKKQFPNEFEEAFQFVIDKDLKEPFTPRDVRTQIDYQLKKNESNDLDPQLEKAREWQEKCSETDPEKQAKSQACTEFLSELFFLVKTGKRTAAQAQKDFWSFASERVMKAYFEDKDIRWLVEERFEQIRDIEKEGQQV